MNNLDYRIDDNLTKTRIEKIMMQDIYVYQYIYILVSTYKKIIASACI